MKNFGTEDKSKIIDEHNITSKEQIIYQAFKFHSQGNIQEAAKYYQLFISKGFKDHRVFSNYGNILNDRGKLTEAELFLKKAIELNPNFSNAHYNLGITLKKLGNLEKSEISTKKAIELNPNFALAYSNLGNTLTDLGKLEEAEVYIRKAIKLNPNLDIAHINLGNLLIKLGKLEEAEVYTRKAIQLNPNLAIAHSNLGNILKDLRRLEEAEVYTRKAIKIDPNLAIAHSNLGSILIDLGRLEEAEVYTRKAIKIDPNLDIAHINLGNLLIKLGKLEKAEISTRKAIQLNPNLAIAHSNLGSILIDLGRLEEAEVYTRKAIKIDPKFGAAHYNLGLILKILGNLKEAKVSILKAIEINPDHSKAFFALSNLKLSNKNKIWRNQLFSKNLLDNKSIKDKVNIYFARANIFHKESNFKESSKYLQLANNLNQTLNPSNVEYLLNKSKKLLFESNRGLEIENKHTNFPNVIFIVGIPRSGSTLLESILSMNNNVHDLGELNILEESFLSWKKTEQKLTLSEFYLRKTNIYSKKLKTTTNKWLYNYQYSGIIAQQIPNAKIIYCYRNPLDNILSIYRANFATGNHYSSYLVDCARVYLDQEKIMTEYKKKFRSKIYDLNYDSLVSNPDQEIKSMISWLGWKWEDKYLSPHLNPRSVTTASNVQVRSPINTKSLGGWKNYKEMLKPAMEIITQKSKYKNLKY